MSNSIRRIIDAVTRAYDAEAEELEDLDIGDRTDRVIGSLVGELSVLEWRYLRHLKENDE